MNLSNKKGAEKILSIYWFAILLIVALGVWAMAYAYYQHPLDVREVEVQILSNKIADCISQNGKINEAFFDDQENFKSLTEENFESLCHFNSNVESQKIEDKGQYYIEVNFFDVSRQLISTIAYGDPQIKTSDCETFQEGESFERLSKCLKRRFYTLDSKGSKQILVEIFTGIKKQKKNVKI